MSPVRVSDVSEADGIDNLTATIGRYNDAPFAAFWFEKELGAPPP